MQDIWVQPQGGSPWDLLQKILWRRKWQPTPGKSHGQRSLWGTVHRGTRAAHNLATKQPPHSCFTMVCQFLLHSKANQLYTSIQPLFFALTSHLHHWRALSKVPCVIQYVFINYVFYTNYQVHRNYGILLSHKKE